MPRTAPQFEHATRRARFPAGVLALVTVAAAMLANAAPAFAQRIMKDVPEPVRGLEIVNHTGKTIPLDLQFTDSNGKKITLAALFYKDAGGGAADAPSKRPVIMMMMYFRCPLLCPKTLEEFTRTLSGLDFTIGTEYDAVIVSFDPRDTPADAARFKTGALLDYTKPTTDAIRSGWSFLTGPVENSKALADALGFPYRFHPDSGEFSHGTAIFVLTPDGTISRYLPGIQSTLEFPVRDTRLALVEASQGKLGTTFDRFTLWCYHFDPNAGAYVVQAFRVMQLGAGATAVALATLVGSLLLRERRNRRRVAAPGGPAEYSAGNDPRGGVPARGATARWSMGDVAGQAR
ncbi:MAG: SCO family protein [Phycisphaeraceae bacterium]|nr:SCO family protein [Phycisphaeraceae bacterium]